MELNVIKCMDCLEFLHQIPDNSVDLIVTSPPYNKEYYNKHRLPTKWDAFKTKVRAINYGVYSDIMDPFSYSLWQSAILEECLRVIKPSGSIFYNHKDILYEHRAIHPTFVWEFPVRQMLIWDRKCTPTIDKSYFFPIHEYVFWISKGRSKFNRNRTSLDFRKSVLPFTREIRNSHPAPFPKELPRTFIECCTDEGDIVLDPFMGSGTTALAAKELNRFYIGCEINPLFVQQCNLRLGQFYLGLGVQSLI